MIMIDGDLYVECSDWIGSSSILGGDDCADGNIFIHPNAAETVAKVKIVITKNVAILMQI